MIKPDLNPSSTFMIIGEAPGRTELSEGRCFVGASGRVLWAVAAECGIRRVDCDVTNVVLSAPLGKSGAPTPSQISDEHPRLARDMQASQAKVLIPLGGIALRAVMGKRPRYPKFNPNSITDMRGYLQKPEDAMSYRMKEKVRVRDGEYRSSRGCGSCNGRGTICDWAPIFDPNDTCSWCEGSGWKYRKGDPKYKSMVVTKQLPAVMPPRCEWIIASLHPSAVMRMKFKTIPALKADLDRAARASRGELEVVDPDALPETDVPLITIDIETPMPPNDWVIEQVGWSSMQGATTSKWDSFTAAVIKGLMDDENNVIAFHNGAFDLPRIEQ